MKKFLLAVAAVAMSLTASADVFLAGGFNGWSTTATPMEEKDGVYTVTVDQLTTEFKVVDNGTWLGSDAPCVLGEELPLSDAGNIKFADGLAALDNAVVTYNAANQTLVVTGQEAQVEVTYAIHGNFATGEWASVEMTGNDNVWTVTFESLENAEGEFGIKQNTNGMQTAWFSCPNEAEYVTISGAVSALLCADTDNTNFKVEGLNGSWDFVFDAEAHTLTVKASEGNAIESIVAENAAAVYYNLSGVRVANPVNGLFIVKQGNKVSKVIL